MEPSSETNRIGLNTRLQRSISFLSSANNYAGSIPNVSFLHRRLCGGCLLCTRRRVVSNSDVIQAWSSTTPNRGHKSDDLIRIREHKREVEILSLSHRTREGWHPGHLV